MTEQHLTAAECARRTGLTVRALRVYEARGLVRPARTGKNWRLYGPPELTRLAAIAALKSLGFSLAEIGTALRKATPDLGSLLAQRAEAWRREIAAAEHALFVTETARARLDAGGTLGLDQLATLVRIMNMNQLPKPLQDAAAALYSPEERQEIAARKAALHDDPSHGAAAWAELLGDLRRLMANGADPASPEAQEMAGRWASLVQSFTGGDGAVEAKARGFWERALEDDPKGQALPFSRAEWDYVRDALRAGTRTG